MQGASKLIILSFLITLLFQIAKLLTTKMTRSYPYPTHATAKLARWIASSIEASYLAIQTIITLLTSIPLPI